jgi:hypothetical protein
MRVVNRAAAYATGIANIDKGAGASLKHVGEVLCRGNEASIPIDVRLADEISRSVALAASIRVERGDLQPPAASFSCS